jgi:hypothetical protein
MSNYTKATNFASKDSLPTGNAGKIVKGTEIDDEFNAIAVAVATKADLASPTFTGTPAAPTAASGTNTTQIATTAFVQAVGGRIVQTVVGTAGAAYTTSSSYTSTGMTATITPTSTSSKILILAHAMLWQTNAYAGGTNGWVALYKNGSNLVSGSNWAIVNDAGTSYGAYAISHLDSPASVSALTYAIYFKTNGGDIAHNSDGNAGSIILMEVL